MTKLEWVGSRGMDLLRYHTLYYVLHYLKLISVPFRIGRLNIVRYLITEQNCNPQCADDVGRTPLHLACRYVPLSECIHGMDSLVLWMVSSQY